VYRTGSRTTRPLSRMATYTPSSPAFHVTPQVLYDMAWMVAEREKRIKDTCCSICLEPMTIHNSYETPCGHTFHTNCLLKWRDQEKSTCPMCRHQIFPDPDMRFPINGVMVSVVDQDLESWLRMLNLSEY
jgi:hypothetical protein